MSTLFKQAARVTVSASRSFSTTPLRRDLVRDIYLREIKAYKPAPVAKDAHVGAVKTFNLPPAPQTPALPADLASELSAYDAAEPTLADAPAPAVDAAAGSAAGPEEFLAFLEQDLPKPEHHHH
ncbi:hypothetical protein AX16_007300 [Volvariella volvacea WC 439]|nr:hypothetical protein AX16_007300 [Volvariella volvacea WC 439]